MYVHSIKMAEKRSPTPSLHKDSNLGVPTSPLRFYLGGRKGLWFGECRERYKRDYLFL